MSASLIILILMPMFVFLLISSLPDFFKYLFYKISSLWKKTIIGETEQPILILEYKQMFRRGQVFLLLAAVYMFFYAARSTAAQDAMYRPFFSLSKAQSYVLYYWAMKIDSFVVLIWLGLRSIKFYNKRVLFFKSTVILENDIYGSKKFILNDHVWLVKSYKQIVFWLYDDQKGMKIEIFDSRNMILDSQLKKSLDDYLNRIPEKNKKVYFTT